MALTLLFACCLVLACVADVTTEENIDDVIVNFEPYEEAWEAYKEKFGKLIWYLALCCTTQECILLHLSCVESK